MEKASTKKEKRKSGEGARGTRKKKEGVLGHFTTERLLPGDPFKFLGSVYFLAIQKHLLLCQCCISC